MKPFELYKPSSVEEAVEILSARGVDAAVYAGGTDILDRLKNRLQSSPKYLVDLKGIKGLRSIKKNGDGSLVIGALTTLTEIVESDLVASSHGVLSETTKTVSSPELRNQSTLGGDLLQEVWCPYLRSNYPCWRNGGTNCFAEVGDNRVYQSVMGATHSYAVYHGDLAPILLGLDATVNVVGPAGGRTLTIEQLLPGDLLVVEEGKKKVQSHSLGRNEILTEVMIPRLEGAIATFEKVRHRNVWDFALASLAMVLWLKGEAGRETIADSRIVFGGVATKPWRDKVVENFLRGKLIAPGLGVQAAEKALQGSRPLKYNAYKIDMAAGLLYGGLEKAATKESS